MISHFCSFLCLALVTAAIPLRAADRPHAGADRQTIKVWTNDDLEKLHHAGLISVVGQTNEETLTSASVPQPYTKTRDPEWYAQQAARLRDELERRRAHLDGYRQTLEDARSQRESTGGINLDEGDTGITPEAGIEILQQGVSERQSELDALEDLARRNDIEPGTLRGR